MSEFERGELAHVPQPALTMSVMVQLNVFEWVETPRGWRAKMYSQALALGFPDIAKRINWELDLRDDTIALLRGELRGSRVPRAETSLLPDASIDDLVRDSRALGFLLRERFGVSVGEFNRVSRMLSKGKLPNSHGLSGPLENEEDDDDE